MSSHNQLACCNLLLVPGIVVAGTKKSQAWAPVVLEHCPLPEGDPSKPKRAMQWGAVSVKQRLEPYQFLTDAR
jgi:hypothetical protein